MFHNNNNAAIRRLSDRSLKANKTRNIFAILAIVLTTVLFTVVITLAVSLNEEIQFDKVRNAGTKAHALFKNVNEDQLSIIRKNNNVKKVGVLDEVVSRVENTNLKDENISLCYLDEDALSMKVYDDLKGEWPTKENEIAVPTWVLDKLELPHTLGQKIKFNYKASNKVGSLNNDSNNIESKEFVISAYYTEYTNRISGGNGYAVISKLFKDKFKGHEIPVVLLKSNDNIDKQMMSICKETGIKEDQFKISPAYNIISAKSLEDKIPIIAMVLLILASGYLIIYNVFYISVVNDIRFYGLLKTIGTTSKQLRKIIAKNGLRLCAIGIPIGIILGYFISFVMVPMIMKIFEVTHFKVSFNPLIFIGTTTFSIITVILACRKPAKMAGKVSPIEALRYSSVEVKRKKGIKKGSKGAKVHKMAVANVFRDRKRATVVLLSLSLGLICFICADTFSRSLGVDAYIDMYVPVDFKIQNDLLQQLGIPKDKIVDCVDENLYNKIKELDEIKNINRVKFIEACFPCEGVFKSNSDAMFKGMKGAPTGEGYVYTNILGVKSDVFNDIDKEVIVEGGIDKRKFDGGEYVVLSNVYDDCIKVGQKINIGTKENPKIVEVMAIVSNNPYYHIHSNGPDIFMNEDFMQTIYPQAKTLEVTFNAKKGSYDKVYAKIKELIGNTPSIKITAKHNERQKFINARKSMTIMSKGIAIIIALIGALNFINTMLTSVNARRFELAMLQAVGMTKNQLKNMLTLEGLYYGGITMFIVTTVGNIVAYYFIEAFKHEANYAVYYFPGAALFGSIAVIILISIIVPKVVFNISMKETVVQRLRDIG